MNKKEKKIEMLKLYGKCIIQGYLDNTHLVYFNSHSNKNLDKKIIVLKKYLSGELPSDEELHDKEIFENLDPNIFDAVI